MNSTFLFEMVLGLDKPWLIEEVKFDNKKEIKELHITINFAKKLIIKKLAASIKSSILFKILDSL